MASISAIAGPPAVVAAGTRGKTCPERIALPPGSNGPVPIPGRSGMSITEGLCQIRELGRNSAAASRKLDAVVADSGRRTGRSPDSGPASFLHAPAQHRPPPVPASAACRRGGTRPSAASAGAPSRELSHCLSLRHALVSAARRAAGVEPNSCSRGNSCSDLDSIHNPDVGVSL